jgi:hypothetical protein
LTRAGVCLLVILAALTAGVALASTPNVKGGKFEVTCKPGAIPDQAIDPIVSPGVTSAHLHSFFGSKALTSTSTPSQLQSSATAGTTCTISQDTAAYWVPTACDGPCIPVAGGDPTRGPFTNVVKPVKIFAYYFGVPSSQAVEAPFPSNLQLVAGNSHALSPADDLPGVIAFSCGNGGSHSSPNRAAPYDCTAANGVRGTDGVVAIVKFPYCLSSTAVEYGDPKTGLCPTGDSTLGQVQIHVHYGLNTTGYQTGSRLNFSSGPYYTFHGDWMNGWDQTKLNDLVAGCLDTDTDCGFLTATNLGPGGKA